MTATHWRRPTRLRRRAWRKTPPQWPATAVTVTRPADDGVQRGQAGTRTARTRNSPTRAWWPGAAWACTAYRIRCTNWRWPRAWRFRSWRVSWPTGDDRNTWGQPSTTPAGMTSRRVPSSWPWPVCSCSASWCTVWWISTARYEGGRPGLRLGLPRMTIRPPSPSRTQTSSSATLPRRLRHRRSPRSPPRRAFMTGQQCGGRPQSPKTERVARYYPLNVGVFLHQVNHPYT